MLAILAIFAALCVLSALGLAWDIRRRRADQARSRALLGRYATADAPITLHPVIDPEVCLGSAACVRACPEQRALVVIAGRGHLADAAGCVGHGACRHACPVSAIRLVFGSARRGVELPELDTSFQTSRRGLYIVGELGGMGLVANAVRQGVRAVEAIAEDLGGAGRHATDEPIPLVIVGAGPAGLGATLAAKERGLGSRTLEKAADLGGSIRAYPRGKIVMTSPLSLPLYGRVKLRRSRKEALVELLEDVVERAGIDIEFGVEVTAIRQEDDALVVVSSAGDIRARCVVLAAGRRGRPRRLGVPGEELPHVRRELEDPAEHAGRACLVVGGGDSALEAALALAAQPRTRVTLSYRRATFSRAKPENREAVRAQAQAGRLRLLMTSEVVAVQEGACRVRLGGERRGGGEPGEAPREDEPLGVPADDVFLLLGRELPTTLLEACGVAVKIYRGEAPAFAR